MSELYDDPVGDRLRAHELAKSRARWESITHIVITLCIMCAIAAVVWAVAFTMVQNKPKFATGVSVSGPWCESLDERQCPIFQPGFTMTYPERK